MIFDNDLNYVHNPDNFGYALCWVIGEECLYDLPLSENYANMFLLSDSIEDVSSEYSNLPGITVRFYRDGQLIEDFNTSEYFGSILLSPHRVINLHGHDYGNYVASPNAKFVDNSFVILDRDVAELDPQSGFLNGVPIRACSQETCHCYKE